MPVEIRELVIRTEIKSHSKPQEHSMAPEAIKAMKKQILEECRKLIQKQAVRNGLDR